MIAIPANKIKRMRAVDIGINQSLFFDQYLKIAFFVMRFQIRAVI